MSTGLVVLVAVSVLMALMFIRVPVAFSLLVAGAFGLVLTDGFSVAMSTVTALSMGAPGKFVLVVVPMFVAMGVFALHGRVAEEGFEVAARVLRRVPGSLALASLATCAAFAAVSGSSAATVVSVGRPAMREMRRHGYDPSVAAGVIGAAGTLGILIPPSIVLVVYGVLTGVSIGALLIAGIIPGVLSALLYGIAIVVRAKRRPESYGALAAGQWPDDVGPDEASTHVGTAVDVSAAEAASRQAVITDDRGLERGQGDGGAESQGDHTKASPRPVSDESQIGPAAQRVALASESEQVDLAGTPTGPAATGPVGKEGKKLGGIGGLVKIGILFFIVIGGIYSGIFTVIESAAIAAVVALIMMVLVRRREGWRATFSYLRDGIMESASLSSMVLALLLGAAMFTAFLTSAAVPQRFTRFMLGLDVPPSWIVAMLLLAFLILGMFLDSLSVVVLAVPVAFPVVSELGFDLIWFGILVIKSVEVGLITPPLGVNAFIVAGAGDIKVEDAFKGVLSYVPVDLATIALFFAVPSLITWLPSLA